MTSRSTAKTVRALWLLWVAYTKPPPGHSRDPIRPPFPPNWGLTTPSENLHHKLQTNGARFYSGLYWQPVKTYHRPTQQYHCRPPWGTAPPQKGVVKINTPSIGRFVGFPYLLVSIIIIIFIFYRELFVFIFMSYSRLLTKSCLCQTKSS